MEQKIKFIAIALAGLCIVSVMFAFSFYTKYTGLTRENTELNKKIDVLNETNKGINEKLSKAEEAIGRLKKDKSEVEKELNRINLERDDLKRKYDSALQDKNELVEKLQESLAKASAPQVETQSVPMPEGSDEYWAAVLKQKADLELQLSNFKDAVKNNQIKMDELTRDKSSLDSEVEKLTKEKVDIQRRLEYNEKMVDSLTLQLVREKDDKRKIEKQAVLFKEENYALRSRLKEIMNNKVTLEKKLKDTDDKRVELYSRLNKVDQLLQDKLSEVIDVKHDLTDIKKGANPISGSAVELSPIVVRSPSGDAQALTQQETAVKDASVTLGASNTGKQPAAKVLSVNEENNFVIFDAGENQGLYKGQQLQVLRADAVIATVEVLQLRANVCAADIKEKTADIKVGDSVRSF